MALIIQLKDHAFSPMVPLANRGDVTANLLRASFWGTFGTGSIALISFIFSRYIIQNDPWKAIAPHVLNATLASCGTFAAVAAYLVYKSTSREEKDPTMGFYTTLNDRVSHVSGALMGTAAGALGAKFFYRNSVVTSFARHSFYPIIGLGIAGSILWLFLHRQEAQLANNKRK